MTSIDSASSTPVSGKPPRPKQGVKVAALVFLSFAGLAISCVLAAMSASAGSGTLADSLCSPTATVNCAHVLSSNAARLGPISSALLGIAYFAAMQSWFFFVGIPNRAGWKWHFVPVAVALIGNAASLYFIYFMAAKLPVWCTWCIAAHVVNGLILLLVLLAWPRRRAAEIGISTPPYPSNVRAGVTLGAAFSISLIILLGGIALHHQVNSLRLRSENHKLANDVDYIAFKCRSAPKQEFSVRPTDVFIGEADAKHTLVVFSDFECAACAELHRNAKGLVKSFPQVRVVFRQFPMCADCNSSVKQTFHRNACEAATAAEAFAELVADPALRVMYGRQLFDSRARFAGRPYAALAQSAGKINPVDFERAILSEAVKRRVAEDIEIGNRLGLEGTPAMFLDGRRLSTWRIVTIDGKPDQANTKKLWTALLAQP